MEINGTGNLNTVLIPSTDISSGFKTYEPQVKTGEHSKSFTQVLIPENENVTEIPKAEFSFFDPAKNNQNEYDNKLHDYKHSKYAYNENAYIFAPYETL